MEKLTKKQMKIVKREHPEWINKVEVGKWYRGVGNKLICITNLPKSSHASAYGFSAEKGKWYNDDGSYSWLVNDLKEATPEEVKQALIAEAKRRYKVGDRLSKVVEDCAECENRCFGCREFWLECGRLYMQNDISDYGYCIFYNGQWASVLSQDNPSLQDDIQALKDRWPDINFTIIAEGKK